MAKGSRPSGAGGGGGAKAANTRANEVDNLVKEMVAALNNPDPDQYFSNGDLQAVVEAFADSHPGVDEDALLDRIRNEASAVANRRKRR